MTPCHHQSQAPGHADLISQPQRTCSLPGKTQPQPLWGAQGSRSHQFPPPAAQSFNFPSQLRLGAAFCLGSPPSPRWFIYEMTHRLLTLPTRIRWKAVMPPPRASSGWGGGQPGLAAPRNPGRHCQFPINAPLSAKGGSSRRGVKIPK